MQRSVPGGRAPWLRMIYPYTNHGAHLDDRSGALSKPDKIVRAPIFCAILLEALGKRGLFPLACFVQQGFRKTPLICQE